MHFKVIRYTDNQNVESIILSGSRKALALRVFQVCLKFRISVEVKWIPRDLNTRADAISKLIDHDDYTINDAIFQRIDHLWGPILLTGLPVPIMLNYQDLRWLKTVIFP